MFTIIGCNVAGIRNKRDSIQSVIEMFKNPSCIMFQETKLGKTSDFPISNYEVFYKNRNSSGGGLLTAIDPHLQPLEVSSQDAEVLTVQIDVGQYCVRLINAYCPQNDDSEQKKLDFWTSLGEEIVTAQREDCLILIQMDANSKVGRHILANDPNQNQDDNGRKLVAMMETYGLLMLNRDSRCSGTVTRYRKTIHGVERAVLDYILVCQNLYSFFETMKIDEERHYPITSYSVIRGQIKVVSSDHNILQAVFNIKYRKIRFSQTRREVFNLKNKECQKKFFSQTEKNSEFDRFSLLKNRPIEEKSRMFEKLMESNLHQCFSKVRIKKEANSDRGEPEIKHYMREKAALLSSLQSIECPLSRTKIESRINVINATISAKSSKKYFQTVLNHTEKIKNRDGNLSQISMWRLKREVMSLKSDMPAAKLNNAGNLITQPKSIKALYIDTYKKRLEGQKFDAEMADLFGLKMELWELTLKQLQSKQTRSWSVQELEKVIKNLKNNKARDPNELVNEIFKSGVMGTSMKNALLHLLNEIKKEQIIPQIFKLANITSLYKKKGSRQCIDNDRGIFIVSILRMILDSLIYSDKFPLIDSNMSVSNIGARSQRNIRDHLFVVYAVINSVIHGDAKPIDIQIYDVEKCFDKLWLEDTMLDLVDTLPDCDRDDKIALVYKLNQENSIAIKTPFGLTDRFVINDVVMQGGKWGPLQCSNTIDQIGKNCIKQNQYLYKYRDVVSITPLAMVDDLLTLSNCGKDSLEVNILINSTIEMKNLRLHTAQGDKGSKCHRIHVGKSKGECRSLRVHKCQMEDVTHDSYLGDIISNDGKISHTIEDRTSRGLGIVSQIFDLLKDVNFGYHHFEAAMALRESYLVNGMLFNSEVWYGVTKVHIDRLQSVDLLFFRKLFKVSSNCPKEAFYLETGALPLNMIIKIRRLSYFHHLVTRNPEEMLYRVFVTQWYRPYKNDWTIAVREDLSLFGFEPDLNYFQTLSKYQFKRIVKSKAKELAFADLLSLKNKHSKLDNLQYSKLQIQKYIISSDISVSQVQILFKSRTRMTIYWTNYKGSKLQETCPVCNTTAIDTQEHSFGCSVINQSVQISSQFRDIFDCVSVEVARAVEKIEIIRRNYIADLA